MPNRSSTSAAVARPSRTSTGHEYIDGLSGLWNVNVGHGRAELAEAAAAQMKELAYFSGYVGSSNIPAITLANRLIEIADNNMQAVFFTSRGRRGERVGIQDRALLLEGTGQARQGQDHRAPSGVPRVTLAGDERHRDGRGYWKMFEPRVPGFVHIQTCYPYRYRGRSPARAWARPPRASSRRRSSARDRIRWPAFIGEPIHGAGGVFYPTDDYWPLRARGLHASRRAADRRRNHHRVLPHRPLVRALALEREARHPLVREGRHIRVSAARRDHGDRGDQRRMDSVKPEDRWMHAYTDRAIPRAARSALKHRDHGARAALGEHGEDGERLHRGSSRRSAITRTRATSGAAKGCSPR